MNISNLQWQLVFSKELEVPKLNSVYSVDTADTFKNLAVSAYKKQGGEFLFSRRIFRIL